MRPLALAGAAGLVGLACCAPALREPPSLAELAAGASLETQEASGAPAARAERLFAERRLESVRRARELWLAAAAADGARTDTLIGAARAGIWLAGHEKGPAERERAAVDAVHAAQLCRSAAPEDPACRYWLALAVGVQARERPTTAHDGLGVMAGLLEEVLAERPDLDRAGPDRVLALLLLRAPGWPAGPGDPDRGLEHARRAVARDPDYPPNQLCLAEALDRAGDRPGGLQAARAAARLAAERQAAGDPEAAEWLDEARRRGAVPEGG